MSLAACDDGGGGPRTSQLMSSPSATLPVRVSPFQLQLATLPAASCPASQPFMMHFDLVLGPTTIDLFIDAVTLRFGDAPSPFAFTADDLLRLFGTTKIPARATRTFTLRPEFGCGFSTTPGSLTVTVTVLDPRGERHDATATAMIR
jgi:hypothetical protein